MTLSHVFSLCRSLTDRSTPVTESPPSTSEWLTAMLATCSSPFLIIIQFLCSAPALDIPKHETLCRLDLLALNLWGMFFAQSRPASDLSLRAFFLLFDHRLLRKRPKSSPTMPSKILATFGTPAS